MNPGYKIILSDNFSNSVNGVITRVTSKNSFIVKSDEELGLDNTWKIENQILKTTSPEYNFLEKYIGNVQDTYSNFDGEVIVASNSIPVYDNTPLEPYNKKIKFSGSASSEGTDIIDFGTNHGFYTGDVVYYSHGRTETTFTDSEGTSTTTFTFNQFEGLDESVYYVKKHSDTSIKLSRSRSNLFQNKHVTFSGTVTDNEFIYFNYFKNLSNHKVFLESLQKELTKGLESLRLFLVSTGCLSMVLNFSTTNQMILFSMDQLEE